MRRTVVLTAVVLLASVLVTATYAQPGGMGSPMPNTQPPAWTLPAVGHAGNPDV